MQMFEVRAFAARGEGTNPEQKKKSTAAKNHIATLIGVKTERIAEYERLHANTWPTAIGGDPRRQ